MNHMIWFVPSPCDRPGRSAMTSQHMAEPQLADSPSHTSLQNSWESTRFSGNSQHMPDDAVYCNITCIVFMYGHAVVRPAGVAYCNRNKLLFILVLSGSNTTYMNISQQDRQSVVFSYKDSSFLLKSHITVYKAELAAELLSVFV